PSTGSTRSTSACGWGITWTLINSPTRRAAAAPASVAAFTAPTSPRTNTVTYPAPIYSLPSSCTLAALTIASAASTAPTKPFVSTIPSASRGISVSPHFFKIVEVKTKTDYASSYHRAVEESREAKLANGGGTVWLPLPLGE